MTLARVKDWLKTYNLFSYYYIGKIVGAQENVLGVYTRASSGRPVTALGRESSYEITQVKLLVHGNKDENVTQQLAIQLFDVLRDVHHLEVNDDLIYFADVRCSEPIDVGMDANRIYEFVINIDIYSRR